jgi:hypothetical protein
LTWFWGLTATTVVSALVNHCQKKGLDRFETFVWQCALCNNQFRIEATKARGEFEEFEPFKNMFEHRVRSIGRIVALISPWNDPEILKRVWCNFEINIATAPESGIEFNVVLPTLDEQAMTRSLTESGVDSVYRAYESVRIQRSSATVKDDVLNIMKIIDPSVTPAAVAVPECARPRFRASDSYTKSAACNAVNARVVSTLQTWFIEACMEYLQAFGNKDTPDYARLLQNIGILMAQQGDFDGALVQYQEAQGVYAAIGATNTPDYAALLANIGDVMQQQGDLGGALDQ